MSEQERVSWVSLIVDLAIGWWYFARVLDMPAGADLFSPGMARFALNMIIFAILVGIATEVLLKHFQKRGQGGRKDATAADERDQWVGLKASRNAYLVLVAAVVLLLSQTAMLELGTRYAAGRNRAMPVPETVLGQIATGPMDAGMLAHLLLLALLFSGITVYASRIFYYRRGW